MSANQPITTGYCLYVDTLCDGWVPIEKDGAGKPIVYPTRLDAERVIARNLIEQLQEFLVGQRDFDDAMNPADYIVEVTLFPDGTLADEFGNQFGNVT